MFYDMNDFKVLTPSNFVISRHLPLNSESEANIIGERNNYLLQSHRLNKMVLFILGKIEIGFS